MKVSRNPLSGESKHEGTILQDFLVILSILFRSLLT